jgi:hypothetical protein
MHDHEPDFWRNLRSEVASVPAVGRPRRGAGVCGGITGLVVVGFTLLADAASEGFEHLAPPR